MKIKLLCLWFFTVVLYTAQAQDHIYSQFYNAPVYLNPALNGQFEGDFRMNMIYRTQWTAVPGPLNYYTLSLDLKIPRLNGGVGLMFTKTSEGGAYLNKMNFSGIYSYSVEFENSTLYFGLQAGLTNRKVDAGKLVFLDQLGSEGIIPGAGTGASVVQFNNKFFFDGGAGINAVIGKLMVGLSGQHLNRPNETLTGETSILPIRYNFYASYRYALNQNFDDSPVIIPSVVLYKQANLNSVSAGLQYKYRGVNAGLWFRRDAQQSDAIVVSFIFDLFNGNRESKTRFGISHDAGVSKLPYTNTAGTTEGAFSYETTFPGSGSYNNYRNGGSLGLKCYDFY